MTVIGAGINHQMSECDHEEADTRILAHVKDALESGSITCIVLRVDTDVLVIIIGKFHDLLMVNPAADIWVSFGSGKNFTYFHVNHICNTLGKDKSEALPVFHSLTGCDTASSFFMRGKTRVGRSELLS